MQRPSLELLGDYLSLVFAQGEDYLISIAFLRANSPSAETAGEVDILGQRHGGEDFAKKYDGVTLKGWNFVGNYAIQFIFSDRHSSGLYTYDYLRKLGHWAKDLGE